MERKASAQKKAPISRIKWSLNGPLYQSSGNQNLNEESWYKSFEEKIIPIPPVNH